MPGPVLVAGIGNIFHRDDGFGPEVARRLDADRTDDVRVVDYGIRGMHLAYACSTTRDRSSPCWRSGPSIWALASSTRTG